MCSGRVDPIHILEALNYGADCVLVTGCHPADCHYITGNQAAEARVKFLKEEFLELIGIDPRRLRLKWVSASEGKIWADYIKEVVEEAKKLGPNPLKKNPSKKVEIAIEALKSERIRWLIGSSLVENKFSEEKYKDGFKNILEEEMDRQTMLKEIRERGPLTITELSEATSFEPKKIIRHLVALRKTGVISEAGVKEDAYLYNVM